MEKAVFLRPNRGWFLAAAGMVAAYILERIDAPLWLAIVTLAALLSAAAVWPWINYSQRRRNGFWACFLIFSAFVIWMVAANRPSEVSLNQQTYADLPASPPTQPDVKIKSGIQLEVGGHVVKPAMNNQRPYIRDRLAEFIGEGELIKKECMEDSVADADALSHGEQWAGEIMAFLNGYMGTEYEEGFEVADGSQAGKPLILPNSRIKQDLWRLVDERIALLKGFLVKVKD